MDIRAVSEHDGSVIRDLHLRMFADSPDAFCETLAAARAMSPQQWEARAREYSDPTRAQAWIALDGDRTVGFVVGFVGQFRDEAMRWGVMDVVTLSRAWVDPTMRQRGIGRSLTEAVKKWAREKQISTLETQVTEINEPAIQFYRALGYVDIGIREPLQSNRSLTIRFLRQSI